jgi:hypothetical protein
MARMTPHRAVTDFTISLSHPLASNIRTLNMNLFPPGPTSCMSSHFFRPAPDAVATVVITLESGQEQKEVYCRNTPEPTAIDPPVGRKTVHLEKTEEEKEEEQAGDENRGIGNFAEKLRSGKENVEKGEL